MFKGIYPRSFQGWVASAILLLAMGCQSSSHQGTANRIQLSPANINLIFVVSQDLAHNSGDINTTTANLNPRGLNQAMGLATYLQSTLLNNANVTGIYALEPATHLQATSEYQDLPDMVPLEIAEQFAMINQFSINAPAGTTPTFYRDYSYPINVCYTPASLPTGVDIPLAFIPTSQGIDFADRSGGNEALVNGIIAKGQGGFYVFVLPFELFRALLGNLKTQNAYDYQMPVAWEGSNILYALTIPPSGPETLNTFDSQSNPVSSYPVPVPAPAMTTSSVQAPFEIATAKQAGSTVPQDSNTNQTVYLIRHAEAHPTSYWEDGNLVYPGLVRARYLPVALEGKIKLPDFVYAVDPAQYIPGGVDSSNPTNHLYSYIRTSQTVALYAIANGIPFYVATSVQWGGLTNEEDAAVVASAAKFFFTGGQFSHKTLLICWEHYHIPLVGQALVDTYFAPGESPQVPLPAAWLGSDYDTIWTFVLDSSGHLTLSNATVEGIRSDSLPLMPPGQ
ncbi:MAG TPA: hypothetical protein VF550_11230 [Polyangia bacterium]